MKEFLIGSIIGMSAGFVVGGIMVARNKKLSNKINQGIDKAEDKLIEAKDALEKKLKNCKIGEEKKEEQSNLDSNSNVCC